MHEPFKVLTKHHSGTQLSSARQRVFPYQDHHRRLLTQHPAILPHVSQCCWGITAAPAIATTQPNHSSVWRNQPSTFVADLHLCPSRIHTTYRGPSSNVLHKQCVSDHFIHTQILVCACNLSYFLIAYNALQLNTVNRE